MAAHKESQVAAGGKFAIVQLDVSDRPAIAKLWEKVPSDLRNVDVLGEFYSHSRVHEKRRKNDSLIHLCAQ